MKKFITNNYFIMEYNIENINKRIKNEIDYNLLDEINDYNLLDEYKKSKSVENEIAKLEIILKKNYIDKKTINNIINEYLPNLVNPGLKGVIRSNKFNILIKNKILELNLDINEFELKFEYKPDIDDLDEIPDWYIKNKKNKKILIGMNQLDLWSGRHQINRGMKYINKNFNDINIKLISVICNNIEIKSNKNKVFKIFKIGFENNKLCYINNLHNIINNYFEIAQNEIIQNETKQNEIIQKGLKRNNNEKFYTNKEIVELCIMNIKKYLKINNTDLIIEPSAGNGSFIKEIKNLSLNYKFYDIEPEHNEIIKQDFLTLEYSNLLNNNKIHIIGNPPFGRQSSIVKKFIKKSILFADTISFILPKSFKKENIQKIFDLKFHLIFYFDLPKNSFFYDNKIYNIPCVFQIWEKKNIDRKNIEKIDPLGFLFVKKNENPDISFRRVGSKSGSIDTIIEDKNINSHYFIKFTKKYDLDKLKKIKFNFNNTVGAKSISKRELIIEFNKYY